ncbi:flagellar hook-associated protein FlgK [Sulfobacillus harzensis]|uniref:Flagellar hook-associated protein 1 n=1 Tax=Sulfobacillus harzensis TaxID=2729629 RepID=A0A7Y0L4C9_9FIRM|nr:flagellar hook-associated protein FlgK [Sulfobacillus harzensis]NMP23082.1 flagellar hook-associated protein FlgK [Sulfobacillus harzensis]
MGFEVLGIASQAIAAQQLALDVTGNNMANATTPGYHVESVNLTENAPAPDAVMPTTLIGNGVTATAVTRATNAFLSSSVRNQTSAESYATALSQGLNQVQNIFQEPQNGGLAEMMNQFNQSWLTLSQNPESLSARESVIQDGKTLASTLNSMATTLSTEEAGVNQNIVSQVSQVNQLAGQIAKLNGQIATVSTSGQQPNDLLDQRGQLLTELTKLVHVSYANGPANSLDVYIGSHPLVTGERTYQINATSSTYGSTKITVPQWQDTGSDVQIQSGSLAGNIALLYTNSINGSLSSGLKAGYLTGYGQKLDNIAQALATAVNTGQAAGYDLNNNPGATFFVAAAGPAGVPPTISASDIKVSSSLSANQLAAASSSNAPGDGSHAESLYNTLSNTSLAIGNSTTTLAGYYQSVVGQVGIDGQNASNLSTDSQNTLTSLKNELSSVTGVDLNQQSVNMIQEQQSYEAAAKLITTQQTMIQSLLSAVG